LVRAVRLLGMLGLAMLLRTEITSAQQAASPADANSTNSLAESVHELQTQVKELRALLEQMHTDMERANRANVEIQEKLRQTERQLETALQSSQRTAPGTAAGAADASRASGQSLGEGVDRRLSTLEEEQQLISGKINEQYQTKVESASKYRVRLSGIALLNLFGNRGAVDNADFPIVARPPGALDSSGNIGSSMRQSELGLEVFGPQIQGANLSANVQMDFSGGVPITPNGVNSGVFRMRTASLRLDWSHTSLVAGQDPLFLSPLTPTSLASLAVPALSYSGNLWAWTPQVRIEHRVSLSENSGMLFQGGILDPLNGELPQDEFERLPQAGEKSRQPAFASRIAWSRRAFNRSITLGGAGYYSRQNWSFGRNVDAWAGMGDWSVALLRWLDLDGEFYRGRGIGGIGAGFGRSALWNGPLSNPNTAVRGLDTAGGWAELKVRPTAKYEFNGTFGEDNSQASELRQFPGAATYFDPGLSRNRNWMTNVVYQPKSDLLLSIEYRRLRTFSVNGTSVNANQVNLGMAVLF